MGQALSCSPSSKQLVTALANGDSKTVVALLEENPELVFWRQLGDGVSPLQLAAVYGPLESVDAIVRTAQKMAATSKTARKSHSVFASVLNHKNAIGQTPLMLACKSRHADIVSYLLAHGADPFLFDSLHSKNCLHYAVLAGSAACCRALLAPDVVIRMYNGSFCLLRDASVADSQGYHRYVDGRCLFAFAPLHFAVSLNNPRVVQELIEAGANLSVRCTGVVALSATATPPSWRPFATPMHIAAARRNVPVLVQLLTALATGQAVSSQDVRSLPDFLGMRPSDIARRVGLVGMAQLLDPATPLPTVLARLQHVQPQLARGPPTLQQLAAAKHRHMLTKQLHALCTQVQEMKGEGYGKEEGPCEDKEYGVVEGKGMEGKGLGGKEGKTRGGSLFKSGLIHRRRGGGGEGGGGHGATGHSGGAAGAVEGALEDARRQGVLDEAPMLNILHPAATPTTTVNTTMTTTTTTTTTGTPSPSINGQHRYHHQRTRSDTATAMMMESDWLDPDVLPFEGDGVELQEWQVRYGVERVSRTLMPRPPRPSPRPPLDNMLPEGSVNSDPASRHMSDHGGTLYHDHMRASSLQRMVSALTDGALSEEDGGGVTVTSPAGRCTSNIAPHNNNNHNDVQHHDGQGQHACMRNAGGVHGGGVLDAEEDHRSPGGLYNHHHRQSPALLPHTHSLMEFEDQQGALLYAQFLHNHALNVDALNNVGAIHGTPPGTAAGHKVVVQNGKESSSPPLLPPSTARECTICCDAHASLQVMKCKHRMCLQCAMHLSEPQALGPPRCPFCRQVLVGFEVHRIGAVV